MFSTLRLYLYGAGLATLLGLMTYLYVKGRSDGYALCKAEQARALRDAVSQSRAVQEADAAQAQADDQQASKLETSTRALINELEDPARECLSDSDARRLRQLWQHD